MAAEKDASEAIRSVVATLPNIQKLKPERDQSLLSCVGDHDVVALLPTGFRNSLIFQLAPLVVKELAKANASDAKPTSRPNVSDWLWQIQSGSGQIQ